MIDLNLNKSLFLFFLLMATHSRGLANGFDVGNGGDAVVCRGLNTSYQLLDLYEWDYLEPDLTPVTINDNDAIQAAMARINFLQALDPVRFAKFKQLIDKFAEDRDINWSDNLRVLRDSGLTIELPPNCQLIQAAIQVPTGDRYQDIVVLMNRNIYEAMDVGGKAALVLHEAVYREAALQGQTNSFNVRSFVRMLFSQQLEYMSPGEYQNYLRKFLLPSTANSEKLLALVGFVSERFSGKTLYSIMRDERQSESHLRTRQVRRSFGLVRAYGSEVLFEETQRVTDLVWDFDAQQNQRSNLRQNQYSIVKLYRFVQMKSGEVFLSIYPVQDSREDHRARVETGRLVLIDREQLVINYETDQYTEITERTGQITPAYFLTQESFIVQRNEGGVQIKTDRQLFKILDIRDSTSREAWRQESLLAE